MDALLAAKPGSTEHKALLKQLRTLEGAEAKKAKKDSGGFLERLANCCFPVQQKKQKKADKSNIKVTNPLANYDLQILEDEDGGSGKKMVASRKSKQVLADLDTE